MPANDQAQAASDPARQRVLVVGGTSGINRGVALGFAGIGARVAVCSRARAKVDDTVAALQAEGAAEARGFCADVRDPEALTQGVDALMRDWGQLDAVISGAAGNFPALASQMSANAFRSVIDIDLLGSFHVLQAVYPHLTRPGASVIHISAPQAVLPMAGQSHVCAAKAGVDMLTRTLALEWGPEGIRVNSVMPGPTAETEGMDRLAPAGAQRDAICASVPLRRFGRVEEIARACQFLASSQAEFITGAVLPVDGGWSLGGASQVGEMLGRSLRA